MARGNPMPVQVQEQVKESAITLASEMGYLNAAIPRRSDIINYLVSHPKVGKVLGGYMDKTKIRSHIKDNILRAFSQQQFKVLPVDEHVRWCSDHYSVNSLILVGSERTNPRRPVYWLIDEKTGLSVFVSECAYKSWESALRSALYFMARNKAIQDRNFRILLSLSAGQSMVSEQEEEFLCAALQAVGVDVRINRGT